MTLEDQVATGRWAMAAAYAAQGMSVAPPPPSVPIVPRYNAVVVSVHDGDTINVVAQTGPRTFAGSLDEPQPIRLLGCNAWELRTPAGDAARDNLEALLPPGSLVVLSNVGDDKFAPRWDAAVAVASMQGNAVVVVDLTAYLCQTLWAAPWNGSGHAPVPPWPREVL